MAEERALHESKLQKMEAEMKMVFQQKVNEKEAKLKQSEEELYARHREMKEALEKQRLELEDKKLRLQSGRPLTPEKVSFFIFLQPFSPRFLLSFEIDSIQEGYLGWEGAALTRTFCSLSLSLRPRRRDSFELNLSLPTSITITKSFIYLFSTTLSALSPHPFLSSIFSYYQLFLFLLHQIIIFVFSSHFSLLSFSSLSF